MNKYIKTDTATLYKEQKPAEKLIELLWGDTVTIINDQVASGSNS